MSKTRTIPVSIVRMVRTQWETTSRKSSEIADHINRSATARKLKVSYSPGTIAAIAANLTRGTYILD